MTLSGNSPGDGRRDKGDPNRNSGLHSLPKSREQRHHLRLAEDVRKINGEIKRIQGRRAGQNWPCSICQFYVDEATCCCLRAYIQKQVTRGDIIAIITIAIAAASPSPPPCH